MTDQNPDSKTVSFEDLDTSASNGPVAPVTTTVPATPAPAAETIVPEEGKQSYFFAKRQNVVPADGITSSVGFDEEMEVVALPSTFGEAIDEAISRMGQLSLKGEEKWARTLTKGRRTGYENGEVTPALFNAQALWSRTPKNEAGEQLTAHSLNLDAGSGKTLKGERAVLTVLSHMGMGTLFKAPLWNSGIWLTVKAPSEARLIEFARQVVEAKITMGRATYGVSFSNHMVYTAELFMTMLEECEYISTASEKVKLDEIISVQDFMTIVWALACAVYPNGFSYRRSCVASPDKCNHVVEERINVSRLQWVNEHALTADQLRFMSNRNKRSVSLEEIKKYQAQFTAQHGVTKELISRKGHKLSVRLKVPTMAEFINVGQRWVEGLSKMVLDALGADATVQARNQYMVDLASASAARQHLHWVESISVDTDLITDADALENIFENVISVDTDLREQFTQHVLDFTNRTMTTVIGIPNFTCPVCKKPQHLTEDAAEDEDPPAIIPLEVVSTFFDLQFQRISLIRARG